MKLWLDVKIFIYRGLHKVFLVLLVIISVLIKDLYPSIVQEGFYFIGARAMVFGYT